jgi:flagellar basal body-associated protein FliL
MSEEQNESTNDGTWSGLKKTIIGTLTTVVAGGGVWLSTQIFGGESDKEETKTEQVAPTAPVVINLQNNNTNQQKQSGGTNTIIKEKTIVEKDAPQSEQPKPVKKEEEAQW